MTDNLIAEIKRLCDETDIETNEPTQARLVGNLRAAIAQHEAHAPTDDEREALARIVRDETGEAEEEAGFVADAILAAGFRRSEVPEPSGPWDRARACFGHCDKEGWHSECVSTKADAELSEPQGEPSDAQVEAAHEAFWASGDVPGGHDAIRAALRAAGGVR